MGISWTKEQQQVIDLQKRNILVSAAAGSGKTAVLVERILQMITRKENPVDIDRLLVVTFTRAAAGEMRERLTAAVEKRLEQEPENEHLQRQQTLIHNAQINTIDGFCSYVIRNYFHTIDLDPGFRVGNEGELKLLQQDTMKELLEAEYAREDPAFEKFVETFAWGKTDEGLGELILRLYTFSMSNPWPEEWLEECKRTYETDDLETLKETGWMDKLWQDAMHQVENAEEINERCRSISMEEDGPFMYQEALDDDFCILRTLKEACKKRDFDGCGSICGEHKFAVLSRKKGETVSDEKRDLVKKERDHFKEVWKNLKEKYFYSSLEQVLEEMRLCRGPVEELIRLTEAFIQLFAEKKRKRNLLDFTDMEHLALDILVKKQDGELVYTPAANDFSQRFEEILIDEYQDSNLVQEMLLQSVSRLPQGQNNIFMVGDVKQSIYRFRLARPELFMEKYETYSKEDSDRQRIDLHKNFRSRPEVLEGINYIFYQIMGRELGDVEYNQDAALYPGASYPEPESSTDTEVLLIPSDEEEISEGEEMEDQTLQELEARVIGKRIRELVQTGKVVDKATGKYRRIRYQDCVILLRTLSGWADVFAKVLMDLGIPAYTASKTGYFSTTEVVTVLNYLHICDNPMQEVPFAGVLLSPIGGCTPEELAVIKAEFPGEKIYGCAWKYRTEGTKEEIREKLERFFQVYEKVREQVPYTPIHELIRYLLKETGYDVCAEAMPGGRQRKANLDMLVEKAMEYESTSYRGLFNFVRYIEQLQKYQVDFGEVSTLGENEDTVRIMSIHKSKGLEFPVVFVGGMGKHMNMMDANNSMIIHPDLGIGTNGVDPELRIKITTLIHSVLQKQSRLETLGEELRVLYVALTRAKEKLILTGTVTKLKDKVERLHSLTEREERALPYGVVEGVTTYWDWILPALARHPAFDGLYEEAGLLPGTGNPCYQKEIAIQMKVVHVAEMTGDELRSQIAGEEDYLKYMQWDTETIYEKETREKLREKFSYQYPYGYLQEIPAKVSVSELKRKGMQEDEAHQIYQEKEETLTPYIPGFMKDETEDKKQVGGATRGNAYHKVMELLDLSQADTVGKIRAQIKKMEEQGRIDPQVPGLVREDKILRFAGSNLGKRMAEAAGRGELYREQPFVMSIPARQYRSEWGEKERILVQGIIDAFFQEEDGLVLMDYKTDYLGKKGEGELIRRYKVQLQYYAQALERASGKKVKEAYLYSFSLGEAVKVVL